MLPLSAPFIIKTMETKNRFLRSATMENMADAEGYVTDDHYRLYFELAQGGAGLLITGAAAVQKSGRVWGGQIGIWDDLHVSGLSKIPAIVHRFGDGAKCAIQLHHGGAAGYGYSYGVGDSDYSLKNATDVQIQKTIDAFGKAAVRARSAGFDAIAVHGAHGYLISQFLSPLTNDRKDAWGGDLEHRLRFPLTVVDSIKKAAGRDMPLLWKLNCDDFLNGGMGMDAYAEAAAALCDAGVDMIEVSGGMKDQIKLRTRLMKDAGEREAYFHEAIEPFRKAVGKKALTVTGGIRSVRAMENLLDRGVDFVGMCRPFISEPDLPNRLLHTTDRREARCTSCNKCLIRIAARPLKCVEFDPLTAILKKL